MAIRVQNPKLEFGIMAVAVRVTHGRAQKDGAAAVVRPLPAPVDVAAGERLILDAGEMDFVYPAGELGNAHMRAVVDAYWEGETLQVDAMTDAATVVADAGYAQAESGAWAITEEAD